MSSAAENAAQVPKHVSRAIENLIGSRIVSVELLDGALRFDVTHKGCDDDACELVVRFAGIKFWDEP